MTLHISLQNIFIKSERKKDHLLIRQQKNGKTLLKNKVSNIEKVSPDFISTGNIGCMTQISNGTQIPIIHTVELLDWFTGGPKPYKLENF